MNSTPRKILVVAPHPDDEMLGCGGSLLRARSEGAEVHWLIVTEMRPENGFSAEKIASRAREIEEVAGAMGFAGVHRLRFPAARLDEVPRGELVQSFKGVFDAVAPEEVYLPFPGDAHSDHVHSFEAGAACCKAFRNPSVRRVLAYETLSETNFAINPAAPPFRPNLYRDISGFLERKIELLRIYRSELGAFPFPRSEEAVRALALYRGSSAQLAAAEAFMLLNSIE